jgi:signal peptidase I
MKFIKDWILPILIAGVIALAINKFIFFNILVPTGSMYPTISPGDRIVVLRIHNVENLKRGDIVVFYSDELKEVLVKRLIGLPGETVEINNEGKLKVNGTQISETYVVRGDNKAASFKVPEGKYLFLGDNRIDSLDARYWKEPYISADKIRGRAVFIMYPFNRMGKLK